MVTAIQHPVPDRVKSSFVIVDIRALWRSAPSVRVSGCQKLQMTRSGTGFKRPILIIWSVSIIIIMDTTT